jgi:hypothetical protein
VIAATANPIASVSLKEGARASAAISTPMPRATMSAVHKLGGTVNAIVPRPSAHLAGDLVGKASVSTVIPKPTASVHGEHGQDLHAVAMAPAPKASINGGSGASGPIFVTTLGPNSQVFGEHTIAANIGAITSSPSANVQIQFVADGIDMVLTGLAPRPSAYVRALTVDENWTYNELKIGSEVRSITPRADYRVLKVGRLTG